jgi:hypothetical protein
VKITQPNHGLEVGDIVTLEPCFPRGNWRLRAKFFLAALLREVACWCEIAIAYLRADGNFEVIACDRDTFTIAVDQSRRP